MKRLGFTLIEILVVISIIGVLAALLLANFVGTRERAADARKKADLRQLKTALRLYYNDNQNYPATGTFPGEGASFTDGGGTTYMQLVPAYDSYTMTNAGDGFLLSIELENASDPDIEASADRCGQTYNSGDLTFYMCED